MGLFGLKKKKEPEIPAKPVEWFYTEEAKVAFNDSLKNMKEQEEVCFDKRGFVDGFMVCYIGTGEMRRNYPATFFADYFRALDLEFTPLLAVKASVLAQLMGLPNGLEAKHNPIVNYMFKMQSLFNDKKGKDAKYGLREIPCYISNSYLMGEGRDASQEEWLYADWFWFDLPTGCSRKDFKNAKLIENASEKARLYAQDEELYVATCNWFLERSTRNY